MKALRNLLDRVGKPFHKGGKLEKLYPVYEAIDTFLYTPSDVTKGQTHVRDGIDLKRTMITVAWALIPCIFMALYNTGLQANEAMARLGTSDIEGWRGSVMAALGVGFSPDSLLSCLIHGALYFVPVFLVCNMIGGICEAIFSSIRGHEINEGFLVTGMLFPLTMPPTIPLWQVAIGIAFGVVVGKEVFGGTGKNFLNPALTARAFLYFAYPAQISGGAEVWTANADGISGATILGACAEGGMNAVTSPAIAADAFTFKEAFLGTIPGSMGETSVLACLFGAAFLIMTGIGSWRIMVGCVLGAVGFSSLLNAVGSDTNPMFEMPAYWHLVVGGFAFGTVFMATDPVSAAMTNAGRWIYGILVGVMTILIRVINPAFPEGIMLAILFGNVFAPLIDYYVVKANIKRRMLRSVKG
ncbi:MAG: NADH:ubiquinone reductase (Na(+)-transporting) subunit B [Planctomycetota bacterium]